MGRKKRSAASGPSLPGFDSVPKMPEGYYSGDRPTPHLSEIVAENKNANFGPPARASIELQTNVETYRGSSFFSLRK